jgi:hypothetical protein
LRFVVNRPHRGVQSACGAGRAAIRCVIVIPFPYLLKNTIRFRQASPVCAGKNHPMNTVSHLQFMEVQQQTYRQVQLHVAQQLGLVDGVDFFDGFHYATVFT